MAFGDFIRSAAANNGSAGTGTITAIFPASGTATGGNLLVGYLRVSSTSCDVLISDNIGGAWTAEDTTDRSTTNRLRRYTKIAQGGEVGATLNPNGTSVSRTIIVVEIAGPFAASYLDVQSEGSGVGSSLSTGTTATTTQADEIAVAGVMLDSTPGGSFSWDSGFTKQVDDGVRGSVATKLLAATGTTGSTATWTTSRGACAQVATYKKVSGTGYSQAVTTSSTTTASVVCQIGLPRSASASGLPTTLRSVGRPITITAVGSASVRRTVSTALLVTASATATAVRAIGNALAGTALAALSLARKVGLHPTTTTSASVSIGRALARALTVVAVVTASVVRAIPNNLHATAIATASVARSIASTLTSGASALVSFFHRLIGPGLSRWDASGSPSTQDRDAMFASTGERDDLGDSRRRFDG